MGDVDERGIDALTEFDDFGTHLVPQLGVKVGERLVHQEYLGFTHDGAADGHTLALAAGERLGLALEIFGDVEDLCRFTDFLVDFFFGELAQLQRKGHVFVHGHVRIQRVVLEDHRDVAILRRHVVDQAVADVELALGDLLEACDHAQRGGFSTAGGADQHDEFLVGDFQVKVLNRDDALVRPQKIRFVLFCGLIALLLFRLLFVVAGEGVDLLDAFECDACHVFPALMGTNFINCPPRFRPHMWRRHYDRSPHCRTASHAVLFCTSFIERSRH